MKWAGILTGWLVVLLTMTDCAGARPPTLPNTAWATAPIVPIVVMGAAIQPSLIKLRDDVPVRLVFRNMSGTPDSFILGDFYPTLDISQDTRQPRSVIKLDPGESREFDVVPRQIGHYALITTLSIVGRADWAGTQQGVIDVLPRVP